MSEVLPKVSRVREAARSRGFTDLDIMVDGGINNETASQCAGHGANAFVAGTFLFGSEDMAQALGQLRAVAGQALFS